MQAYILKSNHGTRFRFGESLGAYTEEQSNSQKTTSHFLHSDTLWSALVNAWAFCHPETVEKFIDECNDGKFLLSSAFYCVDYQNKSVFFLPKPITLSLYKTNEPKMLKRVKFISKGVWEEGVLPEEWFNAEVCTLLQYETIVALKSEIDTPINIFTTETNPKVRARDLNDREDSFFYQTDLFLLNGEGFSVNWYFLTINNMSDMLQNDFNDAMQALVNLGIGGERTTGCGGLNGYLSTNFVINIEPGRFSSSLSLIAPNELEMESAKDVFYQLIKRGGRFLEKGKSLPMIQMLLEGAVFDTDIKGRIVTLNDNPPILRYGNSLCIQLHKNFIYNES